MFEGGQFGFWSLIPLIITLIIAFKTRDAALSLFIGCIIGVLMLGMNPAYGFNQLAQEALGNGDFIWLMVIVIFIGILFSFFKRAGVIRAFADKLSKRVHSKRGVKFVTWVLGLFIIDDYFSPLMSGVIIRPLSDKQSIPREKIAYILDSTCASVCTLVPFTAWGAYMASLLVAQGGPITSIDEGVAAFAKAIPYNFYAIITVIFALLISLQVIPDFGPMKKAEKRAQETGKVIRDGSTPMIGTEVEDVLAIDGTNSNLVIEFLIPILIIVGIAAGTFIMLGGIKISEAFITAVLYLGIALFFTKKFKSINDLMSAVRDGIVDIIPAIMILALAYCINTITKGLGAADYIMSVTENWLTPGLLVAITFITGAIISFSTGTSWGSFALVTPFAIPIAYSFTNGSLDPIVYQCIGAIVGGGIFGDHASPVSDTSVLASTGAGSDHIDHVVTQIPYALVTAAIAIALYLII